MDVRKIREEMQFLTGIVTNDVNYLLYLLLRKEKKSEAISKVPNIQDGGYMKEELLEDWFNKL